MKPLFPFLAAMVLAATVLHARDATLLEAEALLQSRNYAEAAKTLADFQPADAETAGTAAYLRACALHAIARQEDAISACDLLKPGHPAHHKAVFLKAKCLAALDRHPEAAAIFQAEAARLFDTTRKDRLATTLVSFADELLSDATDATPAGLARRQQAVALLRGALDADLGPALRQDVLLKLAVTLQRGGDFNGAVETCRLYLAEFDPDWLGDRGTPQRLMGSKNPRAIPGAERHRIRMSMISCLVKAGQSADGLFHANELLTLVRAAPLNVSAADVEWEICRCHGPAMTAPAQSQNISQQAAQQSVNGVERLPNNLLSAGLRSGDGAVNRNSIDAILNNPNRSHGITPKFIASLRAFLDHHPDHPHAAEAALAIAVSLQSQGKADEALAAFRTFLAGQWPNPAPDDPPSDTRTPEARLQHWIQEATFQIGRILLEHGKPADAIAQWRDYLARFPNASRWELAQSGIIDAEFLLGTQAVEAGDEPLARRRMEEFLTNYPLDPRSRQILFIFGQFPYAEAQRLAEGNPASAKAAPLFEKAISEWERLIGKYPQSEEASLALYNTGVIQEENLGRLETSLETFKRLSWGQWAAAAKERVIILSKPSLAAATERTWRTNETPRVKLSVRNLEKLTVSQYTLSLEAFFRRKYSIDNRGIDALDIDLIEPDKTWELPVPGFAKYRSITHDLEVPFPDGKPGVCLVKTEGGDWRTTSLVLRSDIDLIVQSAQREALVYVENRLTGKPVADAFVLCGNGREIIAEGRTGPDGVCRFAGQPVREAARLCVYARAQAGEAMQQLDLRYMTAAMRDPDADDNHDPGLSPRGILRTDRSLYQPGETVHCRGILRAENDGSYQINAGKSYQLTILGKGRRPLAAATVCLDDSGCFTHAIALPAGTPEDEYRVVVRSDDETEAYSTVFHVGSVIDNAIHFAVSLDQPLLFPGDRITGRVLATFPGGAPVAGEVMTFRFDDLAVLTATTDAQGACPFAFTPGAEETVRRLEVRLPAREAERVLALPRTTASLSLDWDRAAGLALPGVPFTLTASCRNPLRQPVAQKFELTVEQTPEILSNRVLEGVPWLPYSPVAKPVTVTTLAVQADAAGKLTLPLELAKPGVYNLILTGTDTRGKPLRFRQPVTVIDDTKPPHLFLYTPADTVPAGAGTTLHVRSHHAAARALLTIAGQTIIHHRFVDLTKGDNRIELDIPDACWPNCIVSLAFLRDRDLITANVPLTVTRGLSITLATEPAHPAPGEKTKVRVATTDLTGKPVTAAVDLVLASKSMMDNYPDPMLAPSAFFAAGTRRSSELRVASTAGFLHQASSTRIAPPTAEVAVETANAYLNDQQRKDRLLDMELSYNRSNLSKLRNNMLEKSNNPFFARRAADAPSPPMDGAADPFSAGGAQEEEYGYQAGPEAYLFRGCYFDTWSDQAVLPPAADEPPTTDSVWRSPVTTAADGTATIEITLPGAPVTWALRAVGVAPGHLFGEGEITFAPAVDPLLTMQFPATLHPGDSWQPTLTLAGITATEVEVRLALESPPASVAATASVPANGNTRVVFPAQSVQGPAPVIGRIQLVTPGGRITETPFQIPVTPPVMPQVLTAGGLVERDTTLGIDLPGDPDTPRSLTVSLHANPLDALAAMALGTHRAATAEEPQAGQALLATVAVYQAAVAAKAPASTSDPLATRIRQLVGLLNLTQTAGGWTWQGIDDLPDSITTATAYWALVEAKRAGFAVHQPVLDQAAAWLVKCLAILPPEDPEKAAIILHALALDGKADFSIVNRLHRDRAALNEPALAYLAAALVHMGREAMAAELLDSLAAKAAPAGAPEPWAGSQRVARLGDPAETVALAYQLLRKLKPADPLVARSFGSLLAQAGVCPWDRHRCAGVMIQALAQSAAPATGPAAQATLVLNGRPLASLTAAEIGTGRYLEVGPGLLKPGANSLHCVSTGSVMLGVTALNHRPQATAGGLPLKLKDRRITRDAILCNNTRLKVFNDTQLGHAACGQTLRVALAATAPKRYERYLILDEFLPGGCTLDPAAITGTFDRVEIRGQHLRFHFRPRSDVEISYQLTATAPGTYHIPPPVLADAHDPGQCLVAQGQTLIILPPGAEPPARIEPNAAERFAMATLAFAAGDAAVAESHLKALIATGKPPQGAEKDIARMMLWIQTAKPEMDPASVVAHFETLSERHPELVIPFDKILRVAEAYRRIGEFERGWLVYQAAINGSLLREAALASVLEDHGDFSGALAFTVALDADYPDSPDLREAHFTLAQTLVEMATDAAEIPVRKGGKPLTTAKLLEQAGGLFESYLTRYAADERADDAAFGLINVHFSTKDYPRMISRAEASIASWPRGGRADSFHYLAALGHFWQFEFDRALAAAAVVANSDSKDRDYARYITAQIHHARRQPAAALEWYRKVGELYPDARESITAFEEKKIELPEVAAFKPGEPVSLDLRYRNIKAAAIQIYKVDLMKLYLREKNLSNITAVDLAGINPHSETSVVLGDGRDYAWKDKPMELPLREVGAYLVICRGDDLFTSGLVLISPIQVEVREDGDSGNIRASVTATADGSYITGAEVKAIGSGDDTFQAGTTDPRGAFQADGLSGRTTVIVRHQNNQYAIFRGQTEIGYEPPELPNSVGGQGADPFAAPQKPTAPGQPMGKEGYLRNIDADNKAIQKESKANWRDKLENSSKGVKVKEAMEFKK